MYKSVIYTYIMYKHLYIYVLDNLILDERGFKGPGQNSETTNFIRVEKLADI
jgi:hypothetical protein